MRVAKIRLDQLVVKRKLAASREEAQRFILAGQIRSDGHALDKPGRSVDEKTKIEFTGSRNPFVSRGGLKLDHALEKFGMEDLSGMRAFDIGASTGGFTDCMLQHGAREVVAMDTGRGKIHEKLRRNRRVTLLENTNARNVTLADVGGVPADVIAIDVSFISLRLILPTCERVLAAGGKVIALVKPQFEAGRDKVGTGGVVRDGTVHREVLVGILDFCHANGWLAMGLEVSPILGGEGNVEFLLMLSRERTAKSELSENEIERVLAEAYNLQNPDAPAG